MAKKTKAITAERKPEFTCRNCGHCECTEFGRHRSVSGDGVTVDRFRVRCQKCQQPSMLLVQTPAK